MVDNFLGIYLNFPIVIHFQTPQKYLNLQKTKIAQNSLKKYHRSHLFGNLPNLLKFKPVLFWGPNVRDR